ncbi:RsmD family RNA methyltransferase [Candidatus Saccharibacteria bacterium]|nr:RsmD family RNA methyltransferase [Candidatus Saccharibacteria bacterium]
MRIIAGYLGGRTFHEPHGHKTHPMSEKIRGALFNALGDVENLSFLDAFAGSGGLSFEAISRGAGHVIAIDTDRAAHKVLDQNIEQLKLKDKMKAIRANAAGWSSHNPDKRFDIVLLDPPYDQLQTSLLQTLISRHVKPGGLAALSFPGTEAIPDFDGAEVASDKNYGDAQLIFYRKL